MNDIVDFSKPLDLNAFDSIVSQFFGPQPSAQVQNVLVSFQNHPLAWTRFADIIDNCSQAPSKIIALNILDNCVRFRWALLADADKTKIKMYAINFIAAQASKGIHCGDILTRKMSVVLVQILKHEWPHNWPDFIPSLIQWSRESDLLCGNAMQVLLLLSEEVFDFGSEQLTHARKLEIQQQFNQEFGNVFSLCQQVLSSKTDPGLINMTLSTLLRFLKWIPLAYVFASDLLEVLAMKFFPQALFRNLTLECLTEIVGLDLQHVSKQQEYLSKLLQLYVFVIGNITTSVIGHDVNIADAYDSGEPESQAFVQHLSNFITSCLRNHLHQLETPQSADSLLQSMDLLLRISLIDDLGIFKICLDFWLFFVNDLYSSSAKQDSMSFNKEFLLSSGSLNMKSKDPRVQQYSPVLSRLRLVMISKMAKPEEVTIVENESGEVVRETMKDTDMITLYKTMREALVFLTHLDPDETPNIMLRKLEAQVDGTEYSWHNLNTLCWAIGSISGALSDRNEKHFLVSAIRALLSLCEIKRGKSHKAIVASNIMYVVGQYPRFLKGHWRFLKTVVNKLFEFMHEKFEGVQQMACETFLKIAVKCKNQFVIPHAPEDTVPFVETILNTLPEIIRDLEPNEIHTFYEAMGHIVRAESRNEVRQQLVLKLMELPNQGWASFVALANNNVHLLWDMKHIRDMKKILKTNRCVAVPIGEAFIVQMSRIYVEMLNLYRIYSQYVSERIQEQGLVASQTSVVRGIKGIKSEILLLIKAFVENGGVSNRHIICENFLPLLIEVVLNDYSAVIPVSRDPAVLLVFSSVIETFGEFVSNIVPTVLKTLFPCTIEMITTNFEDYPDHRINFFTLLRSTNSRCFKCKFR